MLKWAKLPAEFIKDRRITLTEFRVYSALLLFRETEEGYREPTQDELAEFIGIETSMVSKAIAGLERSGWLRRERGNGRGKKSRYWLNPTSPDQTVEKVDDLSTFNEPEKVSDSSTFIEDKGSLFDPPLSPERLTISPPFSEEDSLYKRNKEEKSKERVKIYTPEPEKIDPPDEDKPPKKRKPILTPMPDGFAISDGVRDWANRKQISPADLERHFEYFTGRAIAKGYTYANWDQAFKNAVNGNWAKIQPTGVNHEQRTNGYRHDRISAAERKRINDEQLDAFIEFNITPGASQTQPEKDVTAFSVRVDG